jgi:hypothetical protein
MFAMGSLLFQVEHGIKPELSVDRDGKLILPTILDWKRKIRND